MLWVSNKCYGCPMNFVQKGRRRLHAPPTAPQEVGCRARIGTRRRREASNYVVACYGCPRIVIQKGRRHLHAPPAAPQEMGCRARIGTRVGARRRRAARDELAVMWRPCGRTGSWTGPPRGERAPRVGISSTVFGVRA